MKEWWMNTCEWRMKTTFDYTVAAVLVVAIEAAGNMPLTWPQCWNEWCKWMMNNEGWNDCVTVWKFYDFPITQMLREINSGVSRSAKSAI